jgi:outer membrane protein assembly factor BamB
MKSFEPSDNEQEIVFDDDRVQFEDLDMLDMQRVRRWQRFLQRMFTQRLRRYWLLGGIGASFVCLLLVLAPLLPSLRGSLTPATADPVYTSLEAVTPQFVYEIQNVPGIVHALRRSDGSSIWSYQVATPTTDMQTLADGNNSLTLVDGFLYVNIANTQSDRIYALRASTGKLLWKYDFASVFTTFSLNVTVANGILYASSFGGGVLALQDQTGKVLWAYQQSRQESSEDVQFNLVDGLVYLSSQLTQRTLVLSGLTGLLLWHAYGPSTFVTFNAGIVYLEDQFDYLYAFQSHTGTFLWKSPGPIFTNEYVIASDDLFVSLQLDGSVEALHVKTSRQAWRTKPSVLSIATLLLVNSRLYVIDSDTRHSLLLSLDPANGRIFWQASGSAFLQVKSIGDHIYVKSLNDQIYALKVETGKIVWRAAAGISVDQLDNVSSVGSVGNVAVDPTFQVADNHVFITMLSADNTVILTVLSDSDGHLLWQKAISGTPLLLAGNAYVTGIDGAIYAYAAESGKKIWSVQ